MNGRLRGMTIVELLVAIALGLVLITGFAGMVVGSKSSSRAERNIAELQTIGRVGLDIMTRELRKAGYRLDKERHPAEIFPAGDTPFSQPAAVVAAASEGVGFTIRYQGTGDGWTTDCLGNQVAYGHVISQSIWLEQGALKCRVRNAILGTEADEILIPQVDDLAIAFGTDDDADGQPDRYRAPTSVTDLTSVISVKVQLRVVSNEDGLADTSQPYLDAGGTLQYPTDKRLRRSFTTVTALRNVLP